MSSMNSNPRSQTKQFWKSPEELENDPAFVKKLEREFPRGASELVDPVSRRAFLQIMGASVGLAGVGCDMVRRPELHIMPYTEMPEGLIPGKAQFYATSMALGEEVLGLLAESHTGRPTKIEGNDKHPASLGATRPHHQASVLDLYDPDRLKFPVKKGEQQTWKQFWDEINPVLQSLERNQGRGLRILASHITSPTLGMVREQLLSRFPQMKWHTWDGLNRDRQMEGIESAFGSRLNPHYQLTNAYRIVSVDCDFLGEEINAVKNSKEFSKRRDPDLGLREMNRLYSIESGFSITGGSADHRIQVKPSRRVIALAQLLLDLEKTGISFPAEVTSQCNKLVSQFPIKSKEQLKMIGTAARDLAEHRGRGLICAGRDMPVAGHALAGLMNHSLGNVGQTVIYTESFSAGFNDLQKGAADSLSNLTEAMNNNEVELLLVLSTNAGFDAPSDIKFGEALGKVKNSVYLGRELNETADKCQWSLPESHYLEEWADAVSYEGTFSIVQPLIYPIYSSMGHIEFVAKLAGMKQTDPMELVKQYWLTKAGTGQSDETPSSVNFEKQWRKWLHEGVIATTPLSQKPVNILTSSMSESLQKHFSWLSSGKDGVEILLKNHYHILDGRFANNSWLQEAPEPMTKLTWDNAALISASLAEKLGIRKDLLDEKYYYKGIEGEDGYELGQYDRPIVNIKTPDGNGTLPVWILPGVAEDTIILNLGYGRKIVGNVGRATGYDTSGFHKTSIPAMSLGAEISLTGEKVKLACTQDHWSMQGRPIIREAALPVYIKNKEFAKDENANPHPPAKNLWQDHDYSKGMQWGMAIDLNICTGCNSCLVACQAENNIPVVGKKQVMLGREMHWIRVDRYFSGSVDKPESAFQPLPCMQCENAPCEAVCPVAATAHSAEGLNDMAYNRCIGTRYCSNNCPFKVRRFNFFNYVNQYSPTQKMLQNPDVTVRFRGVMEKCTYCVQRINEKRIEFKNKGIETIPDGQIITACAQACPTDAIVFGNINDSKSKVTDWKNKERDYVLLNDFNVRPRTSYLARIKNPHPSLMTSHATTEEHAS